MDAIQFTAVIEPSSNKLWGSHFVIPQAIAALFLESGTQRVVCKINGVHSWQCALLPYGDQKRVISVNKTTMKKLGLHFGSTINVELSKDESEYGLPVPEEFAELLRLDPEGNDWFRQLTDGKKRTLLYIAAQPKSSEIRINRAIAIVEHLKNRKGKIDFKILNNDLKN